jgi:uncharacterized hydantoinase/oxoprolinase family protein
MNADRLTHSVAIRTTLDCYQRWQHLVLHSLLLMGALHLRECCMTDVIRVQVSEMQYFQINPIVKSDNYHPKQLESCHYIEAEELVKIILEETPEAADVFNSRREMIEYISEAIASNYVFSPEIKPE